MTTPPPNDIIRARYTHAELRAARQRLCRLCRHATTLRDNETYCAAYLYPITTDGKDCPYYKERTAQ
ncbi:MAG: hypothetical protein HY673_03950 [Chloroflexi bacterium]|nr:hypothetical protein [Chloroflexota bacterium]